MDIKYLGDYSVGFENENGAKYLIIEISLSKDTIIYDYQVEMLEYNRADGILPVELRRNDNKLKLVYDITGLMTLQHYTAISKPSFNELSTTLSSILGIVRSSKKLLLYESGFLMDEDYIYVDNNSIKLIYVPVQTSMDFSGMFKDMVIKLFARAGGEINEKALSDIIKCVKSPQFKLTEIDTIIKSFNKKDVTIPSEIEKSDMHVQQQSVCETHEGKQHNYKTFFNSKIKLFALFEIFIISFAFILNYILNELSVETETGYIATAMIIIVGNLLLYRKTSAINAQKEKTVKPDRIVKNKKDTINEKNIIKKDDTEYERLTVVEETTILKPGNISAYLVECGKSSPEFIEIKDAGFIIGRSPSISDMVINDSSIGRIHAEIIKRDNDYYLIDKNSKNGTYLNETKLNAYEHRLKNNDLIIFANREYKFISDNIPVN